MAFCTNFATQVNTPKESRHGKFQSRLYQKFTMKKIIFWGFLCFLFASASLRAQCLQIESILVDACVPGGGCTGSQSPNCSCEGKNEMVLFKVGTSPINTSSLTVTWPNNNFKGWAQNANTTANVATLNSTIVSCGFLKEPIGNILPANSEVLIITSWDMCTGANSFANLQDTLVVLFQDTGNFQGHFANHNNSGAITTVPTGTVALRSLVLNYPPLGCTEAVTYDRSLLVNTFGTYGGNSSQNDGSTVLFSAGGIATYVNYGCQAPYIPLIANAGANASVCSNDTIAMNGAVAGPVLSYTWTGGSGTFSNPSSVTTNYIPGSGDVGTITLYLTATGKCTGGITDSMQLTILPVPSPTISASAGPVCSGNTFVLSVNTQSGTTYTWNPGGVSGSSFTVTPVSPSVYTVNAMSSCGTASDTYTLDVAPLPSIVVANDTICTGNTGALTAFGAATYTWSTGTNGATINDNPSSTTQYTVVGTDGNGCLDTTVATIVVAQLAVVNASPDTVCQGSNAVLTASGAATYTWSNSQNGNTISVTPSSTTSYTVIGTDGNGCSDTAVATVLVYSLPPVFANNSSVCPGDSTALTASGALTYTWSTSQNGNSISVSPTSATSYTVSGTDTNGCVNSAVSTVTINPLPVLVVNTPTTCAGIAVTLGVSGALTYTWSTAQTGASISVPGSPASYTVSGTDANGCVNSIITSVSILPPPTAQTVTGNSVICAGDSGLLSVIPGPYTYSWSGPGTSMSGVSVVVTQAGVYSVTATNACGSATTQFTVDVSDPQAGFVPNDVILNAPASFTFTNSSLGNLLSNYWDLSNGNFSVQLNSTATYTAEGSYFVSLIVTDVYGCKDTATLTVYVTDSVMPVIIPNIFSPNGDQINDVFSIKGSRLTQFNCIVFNRWGLKLYEWSDLSGGWDGRNVQNGLAVSDGTYYFIVTYVDHKGKPGIKEGFIELVR